MNVPVDTRFAKNVQPRSGRGRNRRLWAAVPLALLTAAGLVACDPAARHDGAAPRPTAARGTAQDPSAGPAASTAATASASPSASASADPSAGPSADASPADGADSDSGPLAAAEKKGDGKLSIAFGGLAGHPVQAGGGFSTFTVTWRNGTDRNYQDIQPVVAAQPYPGARCGVVSSTADGALQRQDPSGWTDLPLSQGTGTDYATTGKGAAFTLAPGASRTVTYRMKLDAADGPGTLPIEADAVQGRSTVVGRTVQNVEVTDPLRPAAAFDTTPDQGLPAPAAGQFYVTVKLTGSGTPAAQALPRIALFDAVPNGPQLLPSDVRIDWLHGGAWAPITPVGDCVDSRMGVGVDPAFFPAALGAGESRSITFRVTVAPTADPALTRLLVVADGTADGHHAATQQHETELHRAG